MSGPLNQWCSRASRDDSRHYSDMITSGNPILRFLVPLRMQPERPLRRGHLLMKDTHPCEAQSSGVAGKVSQTGPDGRPPFIVESHVSSAWSVPPYPSNMRPRGLGKGSSFVTVGPGQI